MEHSRLEALFDVQANVSLAIGWSNGAKMSIGNAKLAHLALKPISKIRQTRDDD